MSNDEITFNANASGTPSTKTDFTYKISPTVISIVDTGSGSLNHLIQYHVPGQQGILARS